MDVVAHLRTIGMTAVLAYGMSAQLSQLPLLGAS
jgi:hypothetical protein